MFVADCGQGIAQLSILSVARTLHLGYSQSWHVGQRLPGRHRLDQPRMQLLRA